MYEFFTTKEFSNRLQKNGNAWYVKYARLADKPFAPRVYETPDGVARTSSIVPKVKQIGDDGRTFLRRISTEDYDLAGDAVHCLSNEYGEGMDATQYNGTVLWSHSHYQIKVAECTKLILGEEPNPVTDITRGVLDAVTQYHCLTQFSAECCDLDAAGLMPATSIGFLPKAGKYSDEPDDVIEGLMHRHFWEWWLKEYSLCEIPMNPYAEGSRPLAAMTTEAIAQLYPTIGQALEARAIAYDGLIMKAISGKATTKELQKEFEPGKEYFTAAKKNAVPPVVLQTDEEHRAKRAAVGTTIVDKAAELTLADVLEQISTIQNSLKELTMPVPVEKSGAPISAQNMKTLDHIGGKLEDLEEALKSFGKVHGATMDECYKALDSLKANKPHNVDEDDDDGDKAKSYKRRSKDEDDDEDEAKRKKRKKGKKDEDEDEDEDDDEDEAKSLRRQNRKLRKELRELRGEKTVNNEDEPGDVKIGRLV